MPFTPVVGDRYFFTWEELGKPTVRADIKVPGFGIIVLDDADVHYAATHSPAGFYVRKSKALGSNHYVVVSRLRKA